MDADMRNVIESNVDTILKDPAFTKKALEGMGLESSEEHALAWVAGFMMSTFMVAFKKAKGRDPTVDEYREFKELMRRRTKEIRDAFMR